MRGLFFLLLLANIVFFAWAEGVFGARNEGREPTRLQQQLQPERLSLVRPAPPSETACRQSKPLPSAVAEQLSDRLRAEGLTVTSTALSATAGFAVRMPSQPNRAAVERKIAELKQLGITDFQFWPEGPEGPFVISFGWFSTEEAANEHLAALNKRGVKTARIEPRARASDLRLLTVQGEAATLDARLTAFSEVTWTACPAQAE